LNTLLSVRLNLEEFDKIPFQFKDYSIDSGRVTFKVDGEFEVDLTIADEDPEKQFWFIDFRFAFSPASEQLSEGLKTFLELSVNDVLSKDGLDGCYRFLHEFVLTHKIGELRRQASELTRDTWTNTLVVEPLHRALAIQYWSNRYGPTALKSWLMISVHSAAKSKGQVDPRSSSYLTVSWHRDGKEIKDVDLSFDVKELSVEKLLKAAIARHIEHILSSIHSKLLPTPRFVHGEAAMTMEISTTEPIDSYLTIQLNCYQDITLVIEPITGFFSLRPHARFSLLGEQRFNYGGKDPAEDGVACLEYVRRTYMVEEVNRRGKTLGWSTTNNPLSPEEIRRLIGAREVPVTICCQRQGWGADWFVMMTLSLSGDEWWLFEMYVCLETLQNMLY
jgi:mediator of RNA polymerase II transcription subunit 14